MVDLDEMKQFFPGGLEAEIVAGRRPLPPPGGPGEGQRPHRRVPHRRLVTSTVGEAAARQWDVVVVGAGHNGLTAAAYLARAGRSVLVLERRGQLGGACTLETPVRRRAVRDEPLRLPRRAAPPAGGRGARPAPAGATGCSPSTRTCGARSTTAPRSRCGTTRPGPRPAWPRSRPATSTATSPTRRCSAASAGPCGATTAKGPTPGSGPRPTRAELEERLGHDPELVEILFDAPIADVIERHVATSGSAPPSTARGSSAPSPGRANPGTRRRPRHALARHDRRPARRLGLRRGRDGPGLARPGRRRHRSRRRDPDAASPSPPSCPGRRRAPGRRRDRPGRRPSSATPTPSGRWRCARPEAAIRPPGSPPSPTRSTTGAARAR